jgi:hypothetical protein
MRLFRKRNRPPKVMRYLDLSKIKAFEFKLRDDRGVMSWVIAKSGLIR